ncbi:hypothetical protein TNCV_2260561 [Trichonephila clavipes]|nr:hypothetical protein TNCV_2260561 [Trichonephila clavipes]
MVISEQKAFCVLQFAKAESSITLQPAFRIKLYCQQGESPQLNEFCDTPLWKVYEPFVFRKPTNIGAYLDALQLWLFPQLEESKPDNFI